MNKIPLVTLERYPDYLYYLRGLDLDGGACVSSGAIAKALGLGEVLVRKDLAFADCVGRPKTGYVKTELLGAIERALCCDSLKRAAVVGVGGLGGTLLSYTGFSAYGISLVCGFDIDSEKIDEKAEKPVYDIEALAEGIERHNVSLALICVPSSAARDVCQRLVEAGVRKILSFVPNLSVPDGVTVRYIDIAANLAVLASM
ncbi:MAG: redox-sensing transcriptional repressor Rex [Clostridia bacterium]|nr:redox-sensing transcriptional repressor Rex [Clostridia bacterium]